MPEIQDQIHYILDIPRKLAEQEGNRAHAYSEHLRNKAMPREIIRYGRLFYLLNLCACQFLVSDS